MVKALGLMHLFHACREWEWAGGPDRPAPGPIVQLPYATGVMERLWLQSTCITVNAMSEADMLRVTKAEAITSYSAKRRRKTMTIAKKMETSAGNG